MAEPAGADRDGIGIRGLIPTRLFPVRGSSIARSGGVSTHRSKHGAHLSCMEGFTAATIASEIITLRLDTGLSRAAGSEVASAVSTAAVFVAAALVEEPGAGSPFCTQFVDASCLSATDR